MMLTDLHDDPFSRRSAADRPKPRLNTFERGEWKSHFVGADFKSKHEEAAAILVNER